MPRFRFFFPAKAPYRGLHNSLHISEMILFLFRIFKFLFFLIIIVWMTSQMGMRYFVFLTNWGFFMGWIYYTLILIDKIILKEKEGLFKQTTMIIFEIAINAEFVISIIYWLALFKMDYDHHEKDLEFGAWLFNTIAIHLISFILLWLDFTFNQLKFRKKNILIVFIFLLTYGIFNLAYSLKYGAIYPIITWIDFQSYLLIVIMLVLTYVHHFLGMAFHTKIKKKYIKDKKKYYAYKDEKNNSKDEKQGEPIIN